MRQPSLAIDGRRPDKQRKPVGAGHIKIAVDIDDHVSSEAYIDTTDPADCMIAAFATTLPFHEFSVDARGRIGLWFHTVR
jgi:hypothetical protein